MVMGGCILILNINQDHIQRAVTQHRLPGDIRTAFPQQPEAQRNGHSRQRRGRRHNHALSVHLATSSALVHRAVIKVSPAGERRMNKR